MRFCLVSDSHGNKGRIEQVLEKGDYDYFFFMGDGINDLGLYSYVSQVYAVSGNCDYFGGEPNEKIITLCGKKILITHGNKYGVKSGLGLLYDYARSINADLVFYGHTHRQQIDNIGGIYFVNPGTFKKNDRGESHYLYLNVTEESITSEDAFV